MRWDGLDVDARPGGLTDKNPSYIIGLGLDLVDLMSEYSDILDPNHRPIGISIGWWVRLPLLLQRISPGSLTLREDSVGPFGRE